MQSFAQKRFYQKIHDILVTFRPTCSLNEHENIGTVTIVYQNTVVTTVKFRYMAVFLHLRHWLLW